MVQAAKMHKKGSLDSESVKTVSCAALNNINQLWTKHSNERFGLTVQKQIWKSVGGDTNASIVTWRRFAIKVGWKEEDSFNDDGYYLNFNNHNFRLSASQGHLPIVWRWWWPSRSVSYGGGGRGEVRAREFMISFMHRLEECNL